MSSSTVRVRMLISPEELKQAESLMLEETPATDKSWVYTGWICLPTENSSRLILVTKNGGKFVLKNNPLEGKTGFSVK